MRCAVCAGVVLAKLGASSVTLTDLAPNLPLLRVNTAALLGDDGVAEVRALEWGQGPPQGCTPPYDVLVGCVTSSDYGFRPPLLGGCRCREAAVRLLL